MAGDVGDVDEVADAQLLVAVDDTWSFRHDRVRQSVEESRPPAAGYGLLVDAAGIACIDMPGMGAMGVHYVNGSLVGDAILDPLTPADDRLRTRRARTCPPRRRRVHRLPERAWDTVHSTPPELFGRTFDLAPAGNRFGLPAAMWNPNVTCHPGRHHERDDPAIHTTKRARRAGRVEPWSGVVVEHTCLGA